MTSKILLCGDSLTQLAFEGWGSRLAHVYQRRADVVNRGMSGYNTRFYLHMFDDVLSEFEEGGRSGSSVALVVLFFGANDAALPDVDAHHYVPVDEYSDNLERMIKAVRERLSSPASRQPPTPPILLITPPPVHHGQRLEYQKRRYGPKATGVLERTLENTGRYAAACAELASSEYGKDNGVHCLDLYRMMLQDGGDWSRFFCDGLHFAEPGHDFLAEKLLATIGKRIVRLRVDPDPITGQYCNSSSFCSMSTRNFPYHDEIDHKNVELAFRRCRNAERGEEEEAPATK